MVSRCDVKSVAHKKKKQRQEKRRTGKPWLQRPPRAPFPSRYADPSFQCFLGMDGLPMRARALAPLTWSGPYGGRGIQDLHGSFPGPSLICWTRKPSIRGKGSVDSRTKMNDAEPGGRKQQQTTTTTPPHFSYCTEVKRWYQGRTITTDWRVRIPSLARLAIPSDLETFFLPYPTAAWTIFFFPLLIGTIMSCSTSSCSWRQRIHEEPGTRGVRRGRLWHRRFPSCSGRGKRTVGFDRRWRTSVCWSRRPSTSTTPSTGSSLAGGGTAPWPRADSSSHRGRQGRTRPSGSAAMGSSRSNYY